MHQWVLLLAIIAGGPALAQSSWAQLPSAQWPGPQGAESGKMREQEWRIPGPGGVLMDATVFRPPGEARAPLVVVNHGSPPNASERPRMTRPRFSAISSYFVSRGYVVALPLRRG